MDALFQGLLQHFVALQRSYNFVVFTFLQGPTRLSLLQFFCRTHTALRWLRRGLLGFWHFDKLLEGHKFKIRRLHRLWVNRRYKFNLLVLSYFIALSSFRAWLSNFIQGILLILFAIFVLPFKSFANLVEPFGFSRNKLCNLVKSKFLNTSAFYRVSNGQLNWGILVGRAGSLTQMTKRLFSSDFVGISQL